MNISYIKTKLKKPTKDRLIQIQKREKLKKFVRAEIKKKLANCPPLTQ